jgi:hypothetical protein
LQVKPHAPLLQAAVALATLVVQTVPQAPQLLLSPRVPLAQAHTPLTHVWPWVQVVPQVPQLLTSPRVPLAQAHWPLTQTVPRAQVVPQAPQLLASVSSLTHCPLQRL